MKIAIEGCLHGELQKVYETLAEIEEKQKCKIDLLLCCGDFQAVRNMADLNCMAVPDKYKEIGSFYKYYSGELKAPMLTLVIGGNHEASNHLQELPFGGWLCPNIYYLGYCGVVDILDTKGQVLLTIGGLSGIFKGQDYLKGRFERSPFSENAKRSVYHVRSIDTFRLKSMPQESVDIMLSHDWPLGITDYGNVNQLLRCKPFFRDDIARNDLGSKAAMEILDYLQPRYWFSGHLHVKFAAIFKNKTKFLALDKCLPQRRFLQIIDHNGDFDGKIAYNPTWLAILKSTNHLQSSSTSSTQHMPGPGYSGGRYDFSPTSEEAEIIKNLFNDDFAIPDNFKTTAKAFDAEKDNMKQLFAVPQPEAQINPQTDDFCEKLGIDDPISIIDQESCANIKASDLTDYDDGFVTYHEPTKNEDEIDLDDSDEEQEKEEPKTDQSQPRMLMNLPAPKNSEEEHPEDLKLANKRSIEAVQEEEAPKKQAETSEKKVLKRRNAAIYSTNEDD